ncbi:acyl carrier protein [Catenulispora yoronensis]
MAAHRGPGAAARRRALRHRPAQRADHRGRPQPASAGRGALGAAGQRGLRRRRGLRRGAGGGARADRGGAGGAGRGRAAARPRRTSRSWPPPSGSGSRRTSRCAPAAWCWSGPGRCAAPPAASWSGSRCATCSWAAGSRRSTNSSTRRCRRWSGPGPRARAAVRRCGRRPSLGGHHAHPGVPRERREAALRTWLGTRLGRHLRHPAIAHDAVLFELGLDSVAALGLCGDIEARFGLPVAATVAFDHPTIGDLAAYLADRLEAAGPDPGTRYRAAVDHEPAYDERNRP